jgi:hypothetical protein
MNWSDVGSWLKTNAGTGTALIGSLLTGNVPGAIAAGVSLVSSATGQSDPDKALEALQNPETMLKLRELAAKEEASIREHIRLMHEVTLKDKQAEHQEQQETIRSGDNSSDEYVRHTRPLMARQSWYGGALYAIGFEAAKVAGYGSGADLEIGLVIMAPALAYMGFRTADKFSRFKK